MKDGIVTIKNRRFECRYTPSPYKGEFIITVRTYAFDILRKHLELRMFLPTELRMFLPTSFSVSQETLIDCKTNKEPKWKKPEW